MSARRQVRLGPPANNLGQSDNPRTLSEVSSFQGTYRRGVAELTADYFGVLHAPAVITDGSPYSFVKDFNSAFVFGSSIYKTYCKI